MPDVGTMRRHRHRTTKDRNIKQWRNDKHARKGSMRVHRRNLAQHRRSQGAAEEAEAA